MYKKSFLWWRKNRPPKITTHKKQLQIFLVVSQEEEKEYVAEYFEIARNDDLVFWSYPYVTAVLRKAEWDKVLHLKAYEY